MNSPGEEIQALLSNGPLAGKRVLELGTTVAGPFCGRLLADFGADVVKVEQAEGDPLRGLGLSKDEVSLYAASIFRNKRNISLNLRSEEGRNLVRRLVAHCDVLIENFRPGAMERWGLGYEALAEINPALVMVRISGFGQSGPYAERPGYGVVCEAASGLREVTGDPDRPPARVSVSLTDKIAGLYAAYGTAMALLARETTGRGQVVDTALYEAAFSFMEQHVPAYSALGHIASRTGSRLPNSAPNSLYTTRDKRYIHIAAHNKATFVRLCETMGRSELLEDGRFSSFAARAEHTDDIDDIVGEWVAGFDLDVVEAKLDAAMVPASRIFTTADIFANEHYRAREMLVELEDETLGSVTVTGITPKLSDTPGKLNWAGRRMGADTRAVLQELLGLGDDEIDALCADASIVCTAQNSA
ncbi:MAG: crotonobetainyl-CoA:carnitine CoA-transferase CaiB-like acyl-CoA transferase [Gammaproteobacteria bacterium]|jgi:crotonobetainyl-CoA:carnitine CoA-transferase CaiB-like acyl-CoA transferase